MAEVFVFFDSPKGVPKGSIPPVREGLDPSDVLVLPPKLSLPQGEEKALEEPKASAPLLGKADSKLAAGGRVPLLLEVLLKVVSNLDVDVEKNRPGELDSYLRQGVGEAYQCY